MWRCRGLWGVWSSRHASCMVGWLHSAHIEFTKRRPPYPYTSLPLHLLSVLVACSRAFVAVAMYNSSWGCCVLLCVAVERCPPGQVGNRIIRKRINVRVEHVRQSKCRQDFLDRVKRNEDIKRQAKESGSTCACSTWQPAHTHVHRRGGVTGRGVFRPPPLCRECVGPRHHHPPTHTPCRVPLAMHEYTHGHHPPPLTRVLVCGTFRRRWVQPFPNLGPPCSCSVCSPTPSAPPHHPRVHRTTSSPPPACAPCCVRWCSPSPVACREGCPLPDQARAHPAQARLHRQVQERRWPARAHAPQALRRLHLRATPPTPASCCLVWNQPAHRGVQNVAKPSHELPWSVASLQGPLGTRAPSLHCSRCAPKNVVSMGNAAPSGWGRVAATTSETVPTRPRSPLVTQHEIGRSRKNQKTKTPAKTKRERERMPPKGQAKRGREEDEEAQKPATKQRAEDAEEEEEEVGVVAGDLCVGTPQQLQDGTQRWRLALALATLAPFKHAVLTP